MAKARRGVTRNSTIGKWAASLSAEFISCRDLGHVWQPYTARWDQKERVYRQTLMCARCETQRVRLIDAQGRPSGGHYTYTDGYQAPAGTGFLDQAARGEIRLASILRDLEPEVDAG